jgi:hypothetical protein
VCLFFKERLQIEPELHLFMIQDVMFIVFLVNPYKTEIAYPLFFALVN